MGRGVKYYFSKGSGNGAFLHPESVLLLWLNNDHRSPGLMHSLARLPLICNVHSMRSIIYELILHHFQEYNFLLFIDNYWWNVGIYVQVRVQSRDKLCSLKKIHTHNEKNVSVDHMKIHKSKSQTFLTPHIHYLM